MCSPLQKNSGCATSGDTCLAKYFYPCDSSSYLNCTTLNDSPENLQAQAFCGHPRDTPFNVYDNACVHQYCAAFWPHTVPSSTVKAAPPSSFIKPAIPVVYGAMSFGCFYESLGYPDYVNVIANEPIVCGTSLPGLPGL